MNVDLYGLATIENELRGKYYQLHVMTMIDPVSGWFEIAILKVRYAQMQQNANVC